MMAILPSNLDLDRSASVIWKSVMVDSNLYSVEVEDLKL